MQMVNFYVHLHFDTSIYNELNAHLMTLALYS